MTLTSSRVAWAAATVLIVTNLYGVTTAHADETPSVPPGTEATATAPVKVDPNDP
ncbi:MAG: OmpA family protein, partial [Streptomyces sp.]|nr:OmpA family protein [Streptomyces sp.]